MLDEQTHKDIMLSTEAEKYAAKCRKKREEMKTFNQLSEAQQEKVVDSLYESELENRAQHMKIVAIPLNKLEDEISGYDSHDQDKINDRILDYNINIYNRHGFDADHVILVIDGIHCDAVVNALPYHGNEKARRLEEAQQQQDNYLCEIVNDYLDNCDSSIYDDEVVYLIENGELSL